jgi:WD40 repeat protein
MNILGIYFCIAFILLNNFFYRNKFEEKHKLEGHENKVKCCKFSPTGEYLATCSWDKILWVWQVDEDEDYEVLSILQRHSGDVKFVL